MWGWLALVQAAATPLPAGVEDDLTCVAVISAAVSNAKPEQQAGLIGGVMYFMGRIDRAMPGIDYAAQLRRLVRSDGGEAKIRAAAGRCGTILQERGTSMQAWGRELQQSEK